MPLYAVGQARFYPGLGRWAYPGETVELPEEVAEYHMRNEPGLLKPVRQTTQARPPAARAPRKPGRRAKK